MRFKYKTSGTCSRSIEFDVEDGRVKGVIFEGGCNGNLQGISKLVEGLTLREVKEKLSGIKCGFRATSCPDQLAKACEKALDEVSGK